MGKRAAAGVLVVATGLVAGLGAVLAGAGVGASAKAAASRTGAPLVPAGVGSSNTAASAHDLICYVRQGFKSEANGKYVAAELNYGVRYPKHNGYAMLRARADHRGPWEEFQFCYDKATKLWSIRSDANHMWVAAETGYPFADQGMLRARADEVRGPREEYRIECIKGEIGVFAIISAANDRYVAAEIGYTGKDHAMLRARSGTVGLWEKFFPLFDCLK
jgi:hypothetical protein